jgi:SAM-dependent methyltransferase
MPVPVAHQFREVAEVYDRIMSVVPYGWWVQYVRQLWSHFECRPVRVLDLACGTGSVLAELLAQGYTGAGADVSPEMLRIAARRLPAGTPLWCQDARSLDLPAPPFDACVCLFDSLNYLTEPEGLLAAFRGVRRHLVHGGLFIFDMNAIRALETGMFNQCGEADDGSVTYAWRSAWDPASHLCAIHMEFRVHQEGVERVFHETHVQRGYSLEQVRELLEQADLEVLGCFDAFTLDAPRSRTDRFHVAARRTG